MLGPYKQLCKTPSDINEHLPILYKYGMECRSILELGVRGCVSSWAFLNARPDLLILNDIQPCDVIHLQEVAKREKLRVETIWGNDLEITVPEVDLVFIDTYHVYGQLKRELAKFGKLARGYIIMHDTEVDGVMGECLRNGWDPRRMAQITGIPFEEHLKGLQPAIDEFLAEHPYWILHEVFKNNNGLTVLKRISKHEAVFRQTRTAASEVVSPPPSSLSHEQPE